MRLAWMQHRYRRGVWTMLHAEADARLMYHSSPLLVEPYGWSAMERNLSRYRRTKPMTHRDRGLGRGRGDENGVKHHDTTPAHGHAPDRSRVTSTDLLASSNMPISSTTSTTQAFALAHVSSWTARKLSVLLSGSRPAVRIHQGTCQSLLCPAMRE